jgi:hypothetical protein
MPTSNTSPYQHVNNTTYINPGKQEIDFNDESKSSNDIPPACGYDEKKFDARLDFEGDLAQELPNANYTSRVTNRLPTGSDVDFEQIKGDATRKLIALFNKQNPKYSMTNIEELTSRIEQFSKLSTSESGQQQKLALESTLTMLKDLNKVVDLKIVDIPKESGASDYYCNLSEEAGGVTEKLCLIGLDKVKTQLQHLIGAPSELNLTDYVKNRSAYKLSTQAILKLPKHGETSEVQREATALNISRILGFTTTTSTMVCHEGKAALFVPFEDIQLMSEFSQGDKKKAYMPNSIKGIGAILNGKKDYINYSTITPVGNGLCADGFLEDFGKKMSFFYLCNDTDFIGAYNQNKAIKSGKELYVFDQVIMSDDKLAFDTRLNMIPIGLGKHSRHNQGRNRSIIEDSSFDEKFKSIEHLLNNQQHINNMLNDMISYSPQSLTREHHHIQSQKKNPLQQKKLKQLQQEFSEVEKLKNDAQKIKTTINRRMQSMFDYFPKLNGQKINGRVFLTKQNLIKKSLLLEKLINNPVIFTNDGRAYKHPWTYRNKNCIKTISEKNGMVNFNLSFLNETTLNQLTSSLKFSNIELARYSSQDNTITLPMVELMKINENDVYPELNSFDSRIDYLSEDHLNQLQNAHPDKNKSLVIAKIKSFKLNYLQAECTGDKLNLLKTTLDSIKNINPSLKEIGFNKHIELKMQMHTQKQLRILIQQTLIAGKLNQKIQRAFDSAKKLDRVDNINQVIIAYLKHDVLANEQTFTEYLEKCIAHGNLAANYTTAKIESQEMQDESMALFKLLNRGNLSRSSTASMLQTMPERDDIEIKIESSLTNPDDGLWEHIDVIEENNHSLAQQRVHIQVNIAENERDSHEDELETNLEPDSRKSISI